MLETTSEEFVEAAGAQWGHLMNDRVPIIAVVDDDESVRESLAGLAESVGYEAALFASAEEFLQSVHHRDSWACLIPDVHLPGMSGVELYSHLHNFPNVLSFGVDQRGHAPQVRLRLEFPALQPRAKFHSAERSVMDTQPLHLRDQSRPRQTKPGGCAIPAADHTFCLLESLKDVRALRLFQRPSRR
jgi:CheY-like chemotaxis protein